MAWLRVQCGLVQNSIQQVPQAEMLLYLLQAPGHVGREICGSTTAVSVFVVIVVNKTIQHLGEKLETTREYYAGYGGLSDALDIIGFSFCKYGAYSIDGYCGESDLERNEVIEKELEDIRTGNISYFHLAISCSTWSILRFLSGGTRTKDSPWGNGTRSDENHGNKQLKQAVRLIKAQTQAGNYWSSKQLAPSLMLSTDVMHNIMEQESVHNILFDQCCYGLKVPDSNTFSFLFESLRG